MLLRLAQRTLAIKQALLDFPDLRFLLGGARRQILAQLFGASGELRNLLLQPLLLAYKSTVLISHSLKLS